MDQDVSFDIQDLIRDVITARQNYESARTAAQIARSMESQMCNDLSALEKELDLQMKKLKEASPPGSHWHNERLPQTSNRG